MSNALQEPPESGVVDLFELIINLHAESVLCTTPKENVDRINAAQVILHILWHHYTRQDRIGSCYLVEKGLSHEVRKLEKRKTLVRTWS